MKEDRVAFLVGLGVILITISIFTSLSLVIGVIFLVSALSLGACEDKDDL